MEGNMLQAHKAFVLREIYGKSILMPTQANSASKDPILLNDVAADIWKEAFYACSEEQLKNRVLSIYGLTEESSEALAVGNFIKQLAEIGLLQKEEN